ARELLDPVAVVLRDDDVPEWVYADAAWILELAAAGAVRAPLENEMAVAVELLDPLVVEIGDVDVAKSVTRALRGRRELARRGTGIPPAEHERRRDRAGG